MQRVAFLVNRTIKKFDNVLGEIEYRCKDDMDSKFFISRHSGHISDMAAEAVREGFKYIVAVGGDGSINEAVNGILSQFKTSEGVGPETYDWDEVKKIHIGLFPGGSGNDFSRSLDIRPNIRKLKALIHDDRVRHLDIGWTKFTGINGREKERFFVNITDVGAGGAVVQHMDKHRIRLLGSNLNYMKAIFTSFATYKKTKIRWTTEHRTWEGKVMSFIVANGKFFGSGLGIAPDAELDDGKFTLITLGDISIMDYLKNMRTVKASRRIEHPEVFYDEASSITIESLENQDLPIDMDGEFVGSCPMTIQCIPSAISFIA